MKQNDIIRIIEELKAGLSKYKPVLVTPDIPGHRPMQITFMPQSKYKFSRSWYVADFDREYYFEVEAWCADQFGPHPKRPDAWSRWVHRYEDQIHFRDKEDYIMFKLRWGT
jgi:hypothetical protein